MTAAKERIALDHRTMVSIKRGCKYCVFHDDGWLLYLCVYHEGYDAALVIDCGD